jgi:hypothetical protein
MVYKGSAGQHRETAYLLAPFLQKKNAFRLKAVNIRNLMDNKLTINQSSLDFWNSLLLLLTKYAGVIEKLKILLISNIF